MQFVIPALKKWAIQINSLEHLQLFKNKLEEILELEGNIPDIEIVRYILLLYDLSDVNDMKIVKEGRQFNVSLL